MRLVSYVGGLGRERLGAVVGDLVVPLDGVRAEAPATMDELLAVGPTALQGLAQLVDAAAGEELAGVRLLSPVPRPRNIVCVGRNYRDHAAEEGVEAPKEPALFLKHTASVAGPGDDIVWDPGYATQVDFEAELAVVIGREARHVSAGEALDVNGRRVEEVDRHAVVARQRLADDLLLNLPVQRDRDMAVALPHIDQRILLGKLDERGAEATAIGASAWHDDGLERRGRKVVL